jgi:hypothetical protein
MGVHRGGRGVAIMADSPNKQTVASNTTAPPPARVDLHNQIVSNAPPAQAADVAFELARLSEHMDVVTRITGLKLTLAVAANTPEIPTYPLTLRKGTLSASAANLAQEVALKAQGYS